MAAKRYLGQEPVMRLISGRYLTPSPSLAYSSLLGSNDAQSTDGDIPSGDNMSPDIREGVQGDDQLGVHH